MHAPPHLRGGLAVRLGVLLGGVVMIGVAITAIFEAKLGLAPWDVLHQGIARHTPISFGLANVVVGVVVVFVAYLLGARIGLGTVANATFVGFVIQGLTSVGWISHLARHGLGLRLPLLLGGIALMGLGTALYMSPGMGAGPRDSLMLVAARRTGVRVGAVRAALELLALGAGFALGGKVGLGTLAFAVFIGPAVEASFWALERARVASPAASLLPAPAVGLGSPGG